MASTVFILGAGASRQAGAPLMADFLDVAHDLWKTGQVQPYADDFAVVFKGIGTLQRVHSKSQLDILNIESVFAAFELAAILGRLGTYKPEDIQSLSKSMAVVIRATIEQTLRLSVRHKGVFAPQPYEEFVGLLDGLSGKANPRHTTAVVTFNYDLAADYALYKNGTAPLYGLESETDTGSIPLLKLHGSLNWVHCEKCDKVVPWRLEQYLSNRHWDIWDDGPRHVYLKISKDMENFNHCEKSPATGPILVPPTWNKSEYHKALSSVWGRAAKELQDAENIFVIGYSLPPTDGFFRYLYAISTVSETPLKRFWVFNPDTTGIVEKRFRELLGPGAAQRFIYYPETFEQAIGRLRNALVPKD
jgi:NAD-dependent SIR2 family protein deacetylase